MENNLLKRLINARIKYGLTQEFVSNESGVSRVTICLIESGKIKPQATTIHKLNKFLSVYK